MGEVSGVVEESWAWIVLPTELLEIVWALIPLQQRSLLSKSFYMDWKTYELSQERNMQCMSRLIRRQIRMNHVYTFSVLLELRGKAWNQRRPWRALHSKYTSFLWYLESVCAHLNRHEMRSIVRHAINRYEGPSGTSHKHHKDISHRQWTSFG